MPRYKLAKRRGSDNWYVVWSEGRRSQRHSTGTDNRLQAELVLKALRQQIRKGSESDPEEVGLIPVLEDYQKYSDKLPSAPQAKIAMAHLKRHLGLITVGMIDEDTIEEYSEARKSKGISTETIHRELSVLKAALNRAVRRKVLTQAPHVPLPAKAPARERYLTREEAARLLRATGRQVHLGLFVRLALYTGARSGAILDLTWDRIDFKRRIIDFRDGVETNKRRAVVPFSGALFTALQRAKRRAETGSVIEYGGENVLSVKRGFRSARKNAKLGKEVTPHTLRHTSATWAAMAGVDLYAVGLMLGHTNARTTARYAKYRPEYLQEAMTATLRGKLTRQSAPISKTSYKKKSKVSRKALKKG